MNREENPNWIKRNWKWFVPVGCFASISIVLIPSIFICFIFCCGMTDITPNVSKSEFVGIWKINRDLSSGYNNEKLPKEYFNIELIINNDNTFVINNSRPEFFFDSKVTKHFGTWSFTALPNKHCTNFKLVFKSLPGYTSGIYGSYFVLRKGKIAFRVSDSKLGGIIYMTKSN
jgi:hypothetical protein